jgi:Ca2+-dependent lipid-binding protein
VWNEVFTFDVDTGKETMLIEVYDKDDFGTDDFEGMLQFDLQDYMDQAPHDQWFDLHPKTPGTKWQGRIRVTI